MWTSLIASVIGLTLRRMIRSDNEDVSKVGTVLMLICFIFGSIFGISLIPQSITRWTLMVMPPSAFFILACIMWVFNNNRLKKQREGVEKK
jgi:Na+-transporting NADH:ubiquinone oxidoreductase subunit NqrD